MKNADKIVSRLDAIDLGEVMGDVDPYSRAFVELVKAITGVEYRREEIEDAVLDFRLSLKWVFARLKLNELPEGVEWPRYEDGSPVMFGDETDMTEAVESVTFEAGGMTLIGDKNGDFAIEHGERVKRPQVLAADGEPLEVGQTVYDTMHGEELTVVGLNERPESGHLVRCDNGIFYTTERITHQRPVLDADGVPIKVGDTVWHANTGEELFVTAFVGNLMNVSNKKGGGLQLFPSQLTHQPPDSWERIESDLSTELAKQQCGPISPELAADRAAEFVRRCREFVERSSL